MIINLHFNEQNKKKYLTNCDYFFISFKINYIYIKTDPI